MKRTLLITLTVFIMGAGARAQEAAPPDSGGPTMTLTGAVYDINGAVIVNGVAVVARGADGRAFQASTDAEGIYKLTLPLGVYDVGARATWFCPSRVDGFRVVNATHGKMSLDFALEVAGSHVPCRHKPLLRGDDKRKEKQKPQTGIE